MNDAPTPTEAARGCAQQLTGLDAVDATDVIAHDPGHDETTLEIVSTTVTDGMLRTLADWAMNIEEVTPRAVDDERETVYVTVCTVRDPLMAVE